MQKNLVRMSWLSIVSVSLTLAIISILWAENGPKSDGKVAVVNGTVISQEEFNRELDIVQQRLSTMGVPPNDSKLSDLRNSVLESLIGRELLYQESKKQGIRIERTDVDEQLKTLKGRFPSDEEYQKALVEKHLTELQIKSQIERGMAIQELVEKRFVEKTEVSEKETKDYYEGNQKFFKQPEQVKASHILIKVDAKAEESKKLEARKELEDIKKKLQQGQDFAELAKEYSQGPSASKGGDLGYFGKGQMVKPFEDAAFALKKNEVSDIVESPFGYHLIKVFDKKPESTIPYGDVKDRLQKFLKDEKVKKQVNEYVEKLKETAKVERYMEKSS